MKKARRQPQPDDPPKAARSRASKAALHPAFDRGDQFERRRLAMVQAAVAAFNRQGVHATSMDEIATALGLSKATLYHYYKSKSDLLYDCGLYALEDARRVAQAVEDEGGLGAEKLERFLRRQFHTLAGSQGSSWIVADLSALPRAQRAEMRKRSRAVDAMIQKFIADGMSDGSIRTTQPKVAEFFLIGALNWVPRWYSPDGSLSSDELATIFIRIVLDGLRAAPATSDEAGA